MAHMTSLLLLKKKTSIFVVTNLSSLHIENISSSNWVFKLIIIDIKTLDFTMANSTSGIIYYPLPRYLVHTHSKLLNVFLARNKFFTCRQ